MVLDTLGSLIFIFVNQKTHIFFTSGGNSVVVCNLTDAIGIVTFNGVKRVVVDVS